MATPARRISWAVLRHPAMSLAAAANDIAACRSTAQEMRRAGVGMPPALIALAALELEYHLNPQPR